MMEVLAHNFEEILKQTPNGWCGVSKAQHLYELTIQSRAHFSIELGTYAGRSLIPIAMAHKDNRSGFVLGVDSWSRQAALEGSNDEENNKWWEKINYDEIYKECSQAIDFFNLNDYCGTARIKSLTIGKLLPENSISLLHQDSNHSEEITCAEVELFHSKIISGGMWVSDDSRWKTVQKSLSMIAELNFELIGEFPNGDNFYKVFRKK